MIAFDEGLHALRVATPRLDLDRQQPSRGPDEEILLKRRVVFLVVGKDIAELRQGVTDNVLVKAALIDAEIPVSPQVLLRLVIELRDEQSRVGHVDFELVGVVIALDIPLNLLNQEIL